MVDVQAGHKPLRHHSTVETQSHTIQILRDPALLRRLIKPHTHRRTLTAFLPLVNRYLQNHRALHLRDQSIFASLTMIPPRRDLTILLLPRQNKLQPLFHLTPSLIIQVHITQARRRVTPIRINPAHLYLALRSHHRILERITGP